MSKPGTPQGGNNLILRRQLQELSKNPVEGFSAGRFLRHLLAFDRSDTFITFYSLKGLVDDSNLLEWEVMIIG